MKFTSDFEKSSFIERCAWKNFIKLYNPFDGWYVDITPYEGKTIYDVCLFKQVDGLITKRIFIEIKVRDNHWDDGLFLETKKYNSIKNLCDKELYLKEDEYKIWYLNFTPKGTFLWDCNITKELKSDKQVMNKATMSSRSEKENKSKWNMPIERAKTWNYIWDESQLRPHYDEYFNKKVKQNIRGKGGLEDILFMK